MASTILQSFNVSLKTLTSQLPFIKAKGFSHIQISPMQSHCVHFRSWWKVYQPVGPTLGNSVGSAQDLQRFIVECEKNHLNVIVDVVFHHTTGCPLCSPTQFSALLSGISRLWWRRDPVRNYESRFNCNQFGPRVDTTLESNFVSQLNYLQDLVDMGVAGFRFDAAKHMDPKYLKRLVNSIKTNRFLLIYAECLDGNPDICNEYITHDKLPMMALDYPMVFKLVDSMGYHGDLRDLNEPTLEPTRSIVMADCHDSKFGDSYHFDNYKDGLLAICFLLARGSGIPLVYNTFKDDSEVMAGIQFHNRCFGRKFTFHSESDKTLLILMREDKGFAILNKSNDWVHRSHLKLPGIAPGHFKELVFDFNVQIETGGDGQSWVQKWDSQQGGFNIGPRQILYVIKD
eukprot:TRINITY_DN5105_c0_g1_i1.p1 TRINITY_DN5105_c0_g1~~TRINITY_DN5105_c0_g1_i1.p1  ORF type:complete len:400 (+),score=63.35 TRINITY_DN5105_c0_g1_i1:78-1277(+)